MPRPPSPSVLLFFSLIPHIITNFAAADKLIVAFVIEDITNSFRALKILQSNDYTLSLRNRSIGFGSVRNTGSCRILKHGRMYGEGLAAIEMVSDFDPFACHCSNLIIIVHTDERKRYVMYTSLCSVGCVDCTRCVRSTLRIYFARKRTTN